MIDDHSKGRARKSDDVVLPTETNRDDPGGAEREAGEPARTKAERGTGATGRTGRDLTRQTGRSQGRGEPQASSERDPGTAGRTRGQPRQTQGGVTS